MVEHIKDEDFGKLATNATKPYIVDFWAPWCGPCKMMGPVFEKVGDEMKDKVQFLKMNVDENPDTPGQVGVRGIPTIIMFKEGKEVGRHTGYMDENALKQFVESNM